MAKTWRRLFCCFAVCLLTFFIFIHPAISDESADKEIPLNQYGIRSTNPYVVDRFIDENGKSIDKIIVPGPPHPPTGFVRPQVANLPVPDIAAGTNTLANVPAMTWVFGCSATSAAIMFGHYDNSGYTNMYTGPTNGGVFPMTNAIWGTVVINAETRALCPLSATRNGLDGRVIRGHVDDYWIQYGNSNPDPFIGNWTEHTQGECTGDYMGTNQSQLDNTDGSTTFYFDPTGAPLYDYTGAEPSGRDGCHGLKLFVASRGYTVQSNGNFNQYIQGQGSNPALGFTFANFKAEIDAGRPVLIQVTGHTMLGYGYNDPSTIYIHDTWDYLDHFMTWGGIYSDTYQHYGVTVLRLTGGSADLAVAIADPTPTPPTVGNAVTDIVTVTNNGPGSASGTTMSATISGTASFGSFSATPSQGTCSLTFPNITCNLGTISNAAGATVTLVGTPASTGSVNYAASIDSAISDPTPGNNSDSNSYDVVHPVPVIGNLSPSSAYKGGAAFTLTVNGINFDVNSQVRWNGVDRATHPVSYTRLTADIPASDIAASGTTLVSVVNPIPGGGTSSGVTFTVSNPPPGGGGGGGGGGGSCFIAMTAQPDLRSGLDGTTGKINLALLISLLSLFGLLAWYEIRLKKVDKN